MSKEPTVTFKGKPLKYAENGLINKLKGVGDETYIGGFSIPSTMRDATPEENLSVFNYIKTVSYNPVNKELNNIKKEIEEKDKLLKFFFADKELSKDDIIEIINEHIEELNNE